MKNLILIATFATTPAAAGTFAVPVKHDGRPPVPYVGSYDPRHMRFTLSLAVLKGADEGPYLTKSIRILYKDATLAALNVYSMERSVGPAVALTKSLEAMRLKAAEEGRLISVDYAAIARQNAVEAWSARDSKEAERLREIIRVE